MALFKCKMCGGSLEIAAGTTVIECEYCGTKQTLPKLDDDRKANLYDRANHFRRNNEFDKAMGIYEQILNEDNTDAEAYWSLVLCRYGIEYVEDPASHKRVPTVNRAQFTSVYDDDNYKSALKYADSFQKAVYEAEANAINEIQKGILEISQKEEPFDVFICYKESDNNGRRTPDSVLANDLYHQLTQEGFKVFFARITLEDKLGSAYEPYIFAALNSAKVMVVLGTKPEYFSAVWVKNEWSRYLGLIKQGQKKMLIPAYKDMDPYDLPEEFSHLQAQDMTKLGFMQDLIRGIKKIVQVDEPKATVVKETVVTAANASTAPLLKRAFMFLEDGDWSSADEYCEKVLDIDPECALAYVGKLMAQLQVKTRNDLSGLAEPFDNRNNYQKAIRFADEELEAELEGYITVIETRNENARLENIYLKAQKLMQKATSVADLKEASKIFKSIDTYKDAADLAEVCSEKTGEFGDLEGKYKKLLVQLKEIEKTELDSEKKLSDLKRKSQEIEAKYNDLQSLKETFPKFEQEITEITSKINALQMDVKRLETERDALGFFARKQKQEKENEILKVQEEIGTLKRQIQEAEKRKKGYASTESVEKVIVSLVNERATIIAEIEKCANVGNKEEIIQELKQSEMGRAMLDIYNKMKELVPKVKVGGTITFGKYPQTDDGEEAPIEWRVLAKENDKILLLSEYGLDAKPYHEKHEDITWENCTLRKWLNKEFINKAFTSTEQIMISEVTVKADKNPEYNTNPGKDTKDKVFLLSIADVDKYFKNSIERECEPTEYAVTQDAYVNIEDGNCEWWLRFPGVDQNRTACVYTIGFVDFGGQDVNDGRLVVRPALWIG